MDKFEEELRRIERAIERDGHPLTAEDSAALRESAGAFYARRRIMMGRKTGHNAQRGV